MNCKISVITIVKNNEETLPRAIKSVIYQTLETFEYIIVNDGSADGTKSIIDDFAHADSRIIPIHLIKNVGRASARNTGLRNVKGDFIFFLDSDDYLPDTSLKSLYEFAIESNADIVFGKIQPVDQENVELSPKNYNDFILSKNRQVFSLEANPSVLLDNSIIGRLYKTETIQNNNICFNEARKNGEDVLFAFYCMFNSKKLATLSKNDKEIYYYTRGNFLKTANVEKLNDSRDNLLEALAFSKNSTKLFVAKEMQRKAAIFSGNFERAERVYNGDKNKIEEYAQSLYPLVADISENILGTVTLYNKKILYAYFAKRFDAVYDIWKEQEYFTEFAKCNQDIKLLSEKNEMLSKRIDLLYSSSSWKLTTPLRFLKKMCLKLFSWRLFFF